MDPRGESEQIIKGTARENVKGKECEIFKSRERERAYLWHSLCHITLWRRLRHLLRLLLLLRGVARVNVFFPHHQAEASKDQHGAKHLAEYNHSA